LKAQPAVNYFKYDGVITHWRWFELEGSAYAAALTIAKIEQLGLFEVISRELKKNLEQGQTFAHFKRTVTPILQAKGWWGNEEFTLPDDTIERVPLGTVKRLESLYHTNLHAHFMAKRTQSSLEAAATHPYWMYMAVMDGNTKASHAALHECVFRHDDPIWRHILPPNSFNCRCQFVAINADTLKRRGLKVQSSHGKVRQIEIEAMQDRHSGEVFKQPLTVVQLFDKQEHPFIFYPDPGFDGHSPQGYALSIQELDNKVRAVLASTPSTFSFAQKLRTWFGR